ncbi:Uncharacterised protein [Candidatus Tiddalikarchaeum anstoanum]|nr:Uncharacterised protein [Candidatus Tiddalikarchaeum anstoanum]
MFNKTFLDKQKEVFALPVIANNIGEVRIKIDTKESGKLTGVRNNMLIKNVEEKKLGDKKGLILTVDLLTTYVKEDDKPLSQFLVEEEMLYAGEEKEVKEILDEWTKDKKIPKKFEDSLIQGLNTICMYDMQFFTNRMRFPPCTGYSVSINAGEEEKKKDEKKEDKKKK